MYFALAPGIPAGQRPAAGPHQIRRRRRLRRNTKPALHMHRHGGRLRRFLGHEHERRGRQLRPLVGLVVQEPGRAPGQVAAALHGDRDVGQRVRDALQRRDRHPQRVAGLGELGRDRHGLLHQADQRRGGEHAPLVKCALIFRECIRSAGQHGAGVGRRRIHPGHGQPADVVHLRGAGAEAQRDDVVAVAHDDRVGDRPGRDEPGPRQAVVLRIEPREPLAVNDIGFHRTEPGQQPGGADLVDPRHRRQRPADLLGHQRQVDQRRPVAAGGFRDGHARCAHGAQPLPQVLVEAGLLRGAYRLDRAVRREEIAVGRLQRLVIVGQAVVEPAQFIAVHTQPSLWPPKKNSCALL